MCTTHTSQVIWRHNMMSLGIYINLVTVVWCAVLGSYGLVFVYTLHRYSDYDCVKLPQCMQDVVSNIVVTASTLQSSDSVRTVCS